MIDWTAEIGSAHKGNKSLAYEYIRAFAEAGATTIKFQFGWDRTAQLAAGLTYDPIRYADKWADDLKEWCDYYGVEIFASIWGWEGLMTARKIGVKRYKIARQMDDEGLIEEMYKDGVPIYKSGGNVWRSGGGYPTYPDDLVLPPAFDKDMFGYSDHAHGIEACLLAVARGATYIEKHVCLDKTDLATRDTPFSATPDEFERMVKIGNGMRRLLDAGA